jgi:hypothetical protein
MARADAERRTDTNKDVVKCDFVAQDLQYLDG